MKTIRWLNLHLEEVIITIITAIMTITLFLQVIFRFVINLPLAWTEEVSIFLLVWLCYYGASLAVTRRRHLRIEIITTFLKPKVAKIFDIISNICFFTFSVFVLYHVFKLTKVTFERNQITAVLMMPKWIPFFGVLVAFVLMTIRLLQDTRLCLIEFKQLNNK